MSPASPVPVVLELTVESPRTSILEPTIATVPADPAPLVSALHAGVATHKRVAAYLASDRRVPFNEEDIFRRYRELDG